MFDTHAIARRRPLGEQADAITDAVRAAAEHGGQVMSETLRAELASLEARRRGVSLARCSRRLSRSSAACSRCCARWSDATGRRRR